MEIDVRPDPSDDERRAVELALHAEAAEREDDTTQWRGVGLESPESDLAVRPQSRRF